MTSVEVLWKSTAIFAAAFAATRLMHRSPAALRHFVWTAAFVSLLVLPAALLVGPKWSAPVIVPAGVISAPPFIAIQEASAPVSRPASTFPLTTVWWIGFALVLARFVAGVARTSWIVRRGRTVGTEDGVRIVESPLAPMPMTWGLFRPVVILPADAATWPAARSRVVLLHELTHVRRRDLLAQVIAQSACCLYWFHPLVWIAYRELRKERERACDDGVLSTGIAAHEYASHVMDLARILVARRSSLADAPAMADTSDLESRIRAMLDRDRNRRPLELRAALSVAAVAMAALLPLASVTALAQATRGTLSGTVNDPSGARVVNATVRAINLDGGNRETTTANAAGEFEFAAIPAGRYSLEFAASGFKLTKKEMILVAGATARLDAFLEMGAVTESVLVKGAPKGPAVAPARTGTPQRIRVGGNVSAARLIFQPKPVYPAELQQAGVEGTVMLTGVISKEGSLISLQVVNTVDPRLAQAAVDAARQWRYQPSLLNGMPVEVLTNIELQFQLGQ